MIIFNKNIASLTHPKVEPLEWLTSMQNVLTDDFFANTWSVERGSSRRIVFSFATGLCISWVYEEETEDTIIQIWENKKYESNVSQEPYPSPNGYGKWSSETKTWNIEKVSPEILASILSATQEKFGDITVCLPWEGFYSENGVEEISGLLQPNVPFFYALGQLTDKEKETIEEIILEAYDENEIPYALECIVALFNDAIVSPKAWGVNEIEVGFGDDWLPPNSPLQKFYSIILEIEKLPNWIVVWDECCAACSHASIQFIAQEKNISEVSPSIILWGQNSQYQYSADGRVCTSLYLDEDSRKELEPILAKYGDIQGLDLS